MIRIIATVISTICLIVLVFTDLTIEQRLLLTGVILAPLVDQYADLIAERRSRRK